MKLRKLGRTGLKVSNLCLGAMTFGNAQWGCDEPTAGRIVARFLDAHPAFARGDAAAALARAGIALDTGRELRLFPHRHGCDGFFAAILERAGAIAPDESSPSVIPAEGEIQCRSHPLAHEAERTPGPRLPGKTRES